MEKSSDIFQYNDVDHMISKLLRLSTVDQTKELTRFYFKARFDESDSKFENHYVDGKDDGGIDLAYIEDNTFHIFQTKFSGNPQKCNFGDIEAELNKINKTISLQNPNSQAEDFVNKIRANLDNSQKNLEIVWITTNLVNNSVREETNKFVNAIKTKQNWKINIDVYFIDKYFLETVIYDLKHGYVPYTGKRSLNIIPREFMIHNGENTGIKSIVCITNSNDFLSWFDDEKSTVDNFLQKNVRGFVGNTIINRELEESYTSEPDLFWYKHNGIIIFVDDFFIDEMANKVYLRNPQIVNGGQTVKKLYSVFKKEENHNRNAKVLIRIYRLSYENSETYKKSIDIISALNSQNKIFKSDLRSNDPTQVILENYFSKLGYDYERKRMDGIKSTQYTIRMRDLARIYYYCKKNAPNQGIIAQVEELFEEEDKYEDIFNQEEINKELNGNHLILSYLTCWNIDYWVKVNNKRLSQSDQNFSYLLRFYVVNDLYQKLKKWKISTFKLGWRSWVSFLESEEFREAIYRYSGPLFGIGRKMIPKNEDPKNFFRRREMVDKFSRKTSIRMFNETLENALVKFSKRTES